jgi:predicted SprT family Zn-dependent metalloprotease
MTLLFDLPQNELVRKVEREQRIGHMTVNPMQPIHLSDIRQQIKIFRMVYAYHDDSKYMLERIQELEDLIAQDDKAKAETGTGILSSREDVESKLADLKEQDRFEPKEETRAEEESTQAEAEYAQNKENLKRVDPTMDDRQADLATAFFQDGMTAKESIEKAKKQLSLEDRKKKAQEAKERVKDSRKNRAAREMKASAATLQKFLEASGIKVRTVKSAEEFERDYTKFGVSKKTQGMFISKTGEIVLNEEQLQENWDKFGKNVVLHEGTHPVINIIRNTDPKRYKKLVDGLKNERLRNRGIQKAWEFANKEQYKAQGEETVEDEFVVESLAQIAAGKVLLSEMPKSKREWLVDRLNDIAKYFTGMKPLTQSSSDAEVRDFAAKLKEAMTNEGSIADVVGKKKVKEFKSNVKKGQKYESDVEKKLSKESAKTVRDNYESVFGFDDFDWNKESSKPNFRSWWKNFENDQFNKNLPKVIQAVKEDIDLLKQKEAHNAKLQAFEELIIPSLGNEAITKQLSKYEQRVLMDPGATIESIREGFEKAKNIIDEDGSINLEKTTPSELFKGGEISLPGFENYVKNNPEYKGVFDDWKKIFDEDIALSSEDTNAFRYPSVSDLENLYDELVSMNQPVSPEEKGQAYEADDTDLELIEGFYSPIEKRINEFKQPRASVQKWRDMVGKKEEAKFTGVYEWLNSMKPEQIISKQEVIDWMRANRVQIKSVSRGGAAVTLDKDEWLRTKENGKFVWSNKGYKIVEEGKNRFIPYTPSGLKMSEQPWSNLETLFDRIQKPNVDTQYSRYQLDTGTPAQNYQETVILAPNTDLDKVKAYNALVDEYQKFMESGQKVTAAVFKKQEKYEQDISIAKKNLPKGTMFSEGVAFLPQSKKEYFQSQHFSEQNVVASLRTNIRTDVNTGEKVFFVEESQSDWGQEGGARGFFNPELTKELQSLESEYSDLINKHRQYDESLKEKYHGSKYSRQYYSATEEEREVLETLVTARDKTAEKLNEFVEKHPEYEQEAETYKAADGKEYLIPTIEGPYVADTNAWTKLNFKFAIKQAVEAGATRLARTNGTQQFERYNSEKISWEKTPTGWNVDIAMTAEAKPERFVVSDKKEFEELITKKMKRGDTNQPRGQRELDKMANKVWNKMQTVEKGDTLPRKEGMEAYYGTTTEPGIVGGVVAALVKELTPGMSSLQMLNLTPPNNLIDIGAGPVQQSIEITPELVQAAEEGMPQFYEADEEADFDNETRAAISKAGIADADVNRFLSENKVSNLNDPKIRQKFEKDFKVKLPAMTKARAEAVAELPKSVDGLIDDVITSIGEDYDSGMDMETAIKNNFTSQPWYNALTQEQKNEIADIIDSTFEEEIKQEEKVKATEELSRELPKGLKEKTKKLEDLGKQLLDAAGPKARTPIRAEIEKLLEGDDKLSYIWNNLKRITNQLAGADSNKIVLTKSGDCP